MAKKFEIRNSTAEFLIFMIEGKEDGVQVMYQNETIWCTQKAMAQLFDVGVPAISKHLKNIFESCELDEKSVISKMETTASDGKFSCLISTASAIVTRCPWILSRDSPSHLLPFVLGKKAFEQESQEIWECIETIGVSDVTLSQFYAVMYVTVL